MRNYRHRALWLALIPVFLTITLLSVNGVCEPARAESSSRYHYFYSDKKIVLHPSPHLLVVDSSRATKSLNEKALEKVGLVLDQFSQEAILRDKGLKLYRRKPQSAKVKGQSLKSLLKKQLSSENLITQPVFEQGQALLIPTAEIIVGFKDDLESAQQREILAPLMKASGIIKTENIDRKSLLLTIDNPGDGRCYQVCEALIRIPAIKFAEPNHLVIMLNEHNNLESATKIKIAVDPEKLTSLSPLKEKLPYPIKTHENKSAGKNLAENGWQVLAGLDAEAEEYPPPGWRLSNANGKTRAAWGRTDYRAFSGRHSIYCAAYGPDAVRPPGPAPLNMAGYLFSPTLDLSSFNEIYIEVWFYSKNEITINSQGKPEPKDLPLIGITNGRSSTEKLLAVIHSAGDCTSDPTTKKGWRKSLYRVPQAYRSPGVRICFLYLSDEQNPQEGSYLDDIRIIGHQTRQDNSGLTNDPYSGNQYELANRGQVAGIGNQDNDMEVPEAWNLVKISPELIVAVIDDGVELKHPDLNLIEGYRADGTIGGGPPSEKNNHGTSVAGNIGAIGNNGIGVVGVAPNVKIMPINGGNSVLERAQAINIAVRKGAKIINNSWGWVGAPSPEIERAVREALKAGVIVLFAAGNGPDRPPFTYDVAFPGNMTINSDVICVGATSPNDEHKSASSSDGQFSWGSSYIGPGPDICAPGPWSYSTDRLGELGYNAGNSGIDADYCHNFGGTSSSCPKVAGVVALMLSANPQLTPAKVKKILQKSADDIEDPGYDDKTGAGRVNAFKAVKMARAESGVRQQKHQILEHNRQYDAFESPGSGSRQNSPPPPPGDWHSVVE